MAHLWIATDRQWAVLPLEGDAFALTASPPQPVRRPLGENEALSSLVLVPTRAAEDPTWVVIAGPASGVSINGVPLVSGIRAIVDRDEIRVGGNGNVYFSTERLARIEEFPGSAQTSYCPRCQQEISTGTTAVRCPGCGVWHHEVEELNCWTYAEVCALCAQSTDLNAGFQWTPEEL